MTVAEKLTTLNNIKQAFKNMLGVRGIITYYDTFADYPTRVGNVLSKTSGKLCNIAYNYQSTVLATPVVLPATEPASPQISYTISSSNLPSYTGDAIPNKIHVGNLLAGCKNNNGTAARTLNWRVKRNGVSIANSASSVPAANMGTLNYLGFGGDNALYDGDILDVYLWGSADLELNRHGLCVAPSRIHVDSPYRLLLGTYFSLAVGGVNNFVSNAQNWRKYRGEGLTDYTNWNNAAAELSYDVDTCSSSYGLLRHTFDGVTSSNVLTSATNYTAYQCALITWIGWQNTGLDYHNHFG